MKDISKKLKPLADRVLIKEDTSSKEKKTSSGIIIPVTVNDDKGGKRGTVVAVGPGQQRLLQEGLTAMQCKVGDRVILPQTMDRVQMDLDDETSELVILPENQLMAILPKE